jgi:glycosyltransferase involved in cell wall biosynthesis
MTEREMEHFGRFSTRNCKPFRAVSIGRLIHWKGFHLALRAFAELQANWPESEYWIVNSGPEGRRLKALAGRLGIERKVRFWGRLPTLQDVCSKLSQCDVLVHPALHEAFGNVCMEAMSAGRPVVCLDLGGPALQVTEQTGIKVPAFSPQQVIRDLAAALTRLANDPDLRARMGQAARRRVREHFAWDKKGEFLAGLYKEVNGA